MIRARGVTVDYGARRAVDDASLIVATGEVVALCGPNGAGKSSLIAALAGEVKPSSGAVHIGGEPIEDIPPRRLARLRAVMEQSPSVSAPFTARALAELAAPRDLSPAHTAAIVSDALKEVGLSHKADEPVRVLSGGQQRRAHLARALAQLAAGRALGDGDNQNGGGGALILDEPTAGLDLSHQIAALEAAQSAAIAGAAVIVALHDLNLAAAFADRVILMKDGRIVADAAPRAALSGDALSGLFETRMTVFPAPNGALCITPELPQPSP
ncbi:MAG: ATP-binding cassette domain-containing protein [Pseudomonadota bacterium]